MSVRTAPDALDPLASRTLVRRLPHLAVALDRGAMRTRLQRLLLDGDGLVAEACARPRAELHGDHCGFQYPLRVRTPRGERRELLVIGDMHRTPGAAASAAAATAPRPARVLEELCMAVTTFPVVAALPTLVQATDPGRISAVLGSAVAGVDLVSLRRSGGAVLRYRLQGGGEVFGKVGYTLAEDVLAALGARTRGVAVPRLVARCTELDLVLISPVPGTRPEVRDPAGRDAAIRAGAIAAVALHRSGVGAGAAHHLEDELARAERALEVIGGDAAELVRRLVPAQERARDTAIRTRAQPAVLAHGDLTPSQLLVDGPQVGLVDLDGARQAEPAFDLGRFVAYLRVAAAKAGAAPTAELGAHLLEAYRTAGGSPVDERRVEAWATAALVQMAAHSWRELKAGRVRLACAVLEEPSGPA